MRVLGSEHIYIYICISIYIYICTYYTYTYMCVFVIVCVCVCFACTYYVYLRNMYILYRNMYSWSVFSLHIYHEDFLGAVSAWTCFGLRGCPCRMQGWRAWKWPDSLRYRNLPQSSFERNFKESKTERELTEVIKGVREQRNRDLGSKEKRYVE